VLLDCGIHPGKEGI
jgi:cleavage and polyadenylation specificity factor subunit 3